MADLYLVTVEDADNGIFYEDPEGFDTEREAREYAAKQSMPVGHIVGIYRCELIDCLTQC